MRFFAFDHRLGHFDDIFGKRLRVCFRRARLSRGFRYRRLIGNRLLFFYFLFSLGFLCLFFLSKAQPGKEATFFSLLPFATTLLAVLFMAQLHQKLKK